MSDIELGDTVRDTISGFEGVAISRHEYIGGLVRFSVQPRVVDNKLHDAVTFDEGLLHLVSKGL